MADGTLSAHELSQRARHDESMLSEANTTSKCFRLKATEALIPPGAKCVFRAQDIKPNATRVFVLK